MDDDYYYYTQVALYSTSMAFDAILLFLPIWPFWKCLSILYIFHYSIVNADNTPFSAEASSSTNLNRCNFHVGGCVRAWQCLS